MANDIELRTWDLERKDIRERNIEKTLAILEQAGITPSNPNYKRYYNATLINVNNTYRFSYNGETDAMLDKVLNEFAETIKDPNVSIDDYERVTKEFLHQRVAKQFQMADGSYASEVAYDEMRKTLNETVQSGMDLRQAKETTFPKEFYNEDGSLRRVVMDIPLEMQTESAMRNIDMIVAKYKDKGIEFSMADNAFIVKGQKVGPQKFFSSKSDRLNSFLEKFEKDPTILDVNDKELFDILEKGDYESFLELGKQRGMAKNKVNEALRAALKDEVIFHEICADGVNHSELIGKMRNLSGNFTSSAKLVSKESEKAVLGRVDRVMFSVVPEDVATQSTFRNWKSCMHATGCNHQYVDDSIGLGSIVAYGYDSQNPQKQVSRLLVHPYYDANGNVAYKVNERIYGKDNTGFRKAVAGATDHFNESVRAGTYSLAEGLYDDNNGRYFTMLKSKDGIVDLAQMPDVNGTIEIQKCDLSQYKKVISPKDANITFDHVILPEKIDLSGANSVKLRHCTIPSEIICPQNIEINFSKISGDISRFGDIQFNNCTFENAIIPTNAKLNGPTVKFINTDIPNLDYSDKSVIYIQGNCKVPGNFKAENATITLIDMKLENIDLSDSMEIQLRGRTKIGNNVKFPNKTKFSQAVIDYDISHLPNIELNNCVLEKGCKIAENAKFTGDVICKDADILADLLKSEVAGIAIPESLHLPEDFNKTNKMFMIISENANTDDVLNMADIKNIIVPDENTKKMLLNDGIDASFIKTYDEHIADLSKAAKTEIKAAEKAEASRESLKEKMKTDSHRAQKVIAETTTDSLEKAAIHTGSKAATKSSENVVLNAVKKADDAVNKAIDTAVEKGAEKLNNTAVGKAYTKAEKAVANSAVGKAVSKTGEKAVKAVSKGAQKVAQTAAGKAVKKAATKAAGKVAAKTGAKAVGKSLLKKIPVVSAVAGVCFAVGRAKEGDWKGACGEALSGVAGCFPGLGTAASTAIDVGLAGRDIHNSLAETENAQQPQEVALNDEQKLAQARAKSQEELMHNPNAERKEHTPAKKTTVDVRTVSQEKAHTA